MKYYSKSGVLCSSLIGALVTDVREFIGKKFSKSNISVVTPCDDYEDIDIFDDSHEDIFDDYVAPNDTYESATVEVDSESNSVNIVKDGEVIETSKVDDILCHPLDDTNIINSLNKNEEDDDEVL